MCNTGPAPDLPLDMHKRPAVRYRLFLAQVLTGLAFSQASMFFAFYFPNIIVANGMQGIFITIG